jgi:ADP-ribosylglycohydrolase
MTTAVRITDDSDRDTIAAAIAGLRAKAKRMPAHWEARQLEVAREVDALVDRWLLAEDHGRTAAPHA